jgi:signal transduction histidine kinase
MRLHGGTLEITSQINIGTTAVAKFPPERLAISGRAIAG